MSLKALVIGSGGREHAMVRQLACSPKNLQLYCMPGNPGTAELAENVNISPFSQEEVVGFCKDEGVELVIIGPEDPLIDGLADILRENGIAVFGPNSDGARLEGDKEYAKQVMQSAGVPTASYEPFNSYSEAKLYIDNTEYPIVVKACGAAQGKGVAVCANRDEAQQHLEICFNDNKFGEAGQHVIIEECLSGPELSVLVVTDGNTYALLAPSRDHKRIGENDTGANTGGMGAFATGDLIDEQLAEVISKQIVEPVLDEIKKRDIDYRGVLYIGLMLTDKGPYILEFNTRFGDPETQVVLPLLNCDFYELVKSTADSELEQFLCKCSKSNDWSTSWPGADLSDWSMNSFVIVGSANGYPNSYNKGDEINIPANSESAWIIQAGTAIEDGKLVTSGGRVLGAVGVAGSCKKASENAYTLFKGKLFDGMYFRRDIGNKFIEKQEIDDE